MKNPTTINYQNPKGQVDPVLEVEKWKDAVYEETKSMTSEELKQYYKEALYLVKQKGTQQEPNEQ